MMFMQLSGSNVVKIIYIYIWYYCNKEYIKGDLYIYENMLMLNGFLDIYIVIFH